MLYRIGDTQIDFVELHVITNPLRSGDEIPWDVTAWAPVPIRPESAERLRAMTTDELFGYGETPEFEAEALPDLVPNLLAEGESLTELVVYEQTLMAIIVDGDGQYHLTIAAWDGEDYHDIQSTLPQTEKMSLNGIHGNDEFFELWTGDLVIYGRREEQGTWTVSGWVTASESEDGDYNEMSFSPGNGYVAVNESWFDENNDCLMLGNLIGGNDLTARRLCDYPATPDALLAILDRTGVACTAHDETPLYTAPDAEVIASCYTRVPAVVLVRDGDWIRLRVGSEQGGFTAWALASDLAFGEATDDVVCTFPSYEDFTMTDDAVAPLGFVAEPIAEDEWQWYTPWLIGTTPSGDWLILVDASDAYVAKPECFTGIGPTEHYNADDWDE